MSQMKTYFTCRFVALTISIFTMFPSGALAREWLNDRSVVEVGVRYGNGCIRLEDNEWIKLDLATDSGIAEFSLATAALLAGKNLTVRVKTVEEAPLVGGCDTGATIRQHDLITMLP